MQVPRLGRSGGLARDDNETKPATLAAGSMLVASCWLLLIAEDGFVDFLRRSCGLDTSDAAERNEGALFDWLLAENVFVVEREHAGVLGLLLELRVAGLELLLARVLGDAEIVERGIGFRVDVFLNQSERVIGRRQRDLLVAGEDLVTSVLLVPLGESRGHVHLLDDVAPAHAGVVGAEADFAFLRGVGNDALLGAAEVVVEQVLEPHAGNEQEVPAIAAAALDVGLGTITAHLAVVLAGCAEGLVELLQQIGEAEVCRRLERVVVLEQSERHACDGEPLAAGRVVHLGDVFGDGVAVEERGDGNSFLGFLIDHDSHADAAVRVAAAAQRAPVFVRPVNQVGPVGEGAHERDGEPVAGRLAESGLALHVVREVRQRVALRVTALVSDFFVASRERNRLERQERDALGIVERELNDAAHLLVVEVVDDCDDGNNLDAGLVQVLNGLQLHIEQIADEAMRVGRVADAVELQVGIAQTGFGGLFRKFETLGEFNAVGRGLHAVVSDFARVGDGVEEVGRQRRLTPGELYRHLTPRLDGDGVVQHGLNFVPGKFVNEADLVGVHEAGIAHHVAAVSEVDGEHRSATVQHGAAAVMMELLVIVGPNVAAGEDLFEMLEEGGVDGHHVFEVAVLGAVLHHEDFAVALDDLGFDFAGLLVHEDFDGQLAVDDLLADFRHALGAERVGGARPSERRLRFLIGLQQRLIGPLGRKRRIGIDAVDSVEYRPCAFGGNGDSFLDILNRFVHLRLGGKNGGGPPHIDRPSSAPYNSYRLLGAGGTTNEDRPNGRNWQFSGDISHQTARSI